MVLSFVMNIIFVEVRVCFTMDERFYSEGDLLFVIVELIEVILFVVSCLKVYFKKESEYGKICVLFLECG